MNEFLLIIFMPLFGFAVCGLILFIEMIFKIRISSIYSTLIVPLSTFISMVLSLKFFYLNVVSQPSYFFDSRFSAWLAIPAFGHEHFNLYAKKFNNHDFFFQWLNEHFSVQNIFPIDPLLLDLKWGILFDSLSSTMLVVITFVSLLVQVYSIEYMSHDINRTRFMSYLSLFVFFMIVLVTSNNFLQMFIGWEGVGLVSYLLINFWFTRVEAARSALKAIGVNKIGDFGIVMAILLIFYLFGSLNYDIVFYYSQFLDYQTFNLLGYEINSLTLIGIFLLVGAVGKSAQLGLHTWLPDAMEGPTPVSALIHAATMVTAGVYLLVRCSPVIEKTSLVLNLIVIIGSLTAFFGASTAFFQNDIKKIIAYSTCSQLGYMFFACGLSAYSAAMFHLVNHAFFKALLFLCAGAVIHAMNDEQDIRKMGGLVKILPFTYVTMLIGSLSLAGFPFLSGFFSKDLIIEIAASNYSFVGYFSYVMALLAAFFTSLYSFRLIYLTFLTKTNAFRNVIVRAAEPGLFMSIPLVLLAILSIISGKFLFNVFIGQNYFINANFWKNAIFIKLENLQTFSDIHKLPIFYKNLPLLAFFLAVILVVFGFNFFSRSITNFFFTPIGSEIYLFFNKKWYFDIVYNKFFVRAFYLFGYKFLFKSIDRGLINFITIPLLVDSVLLFVRQVKKVHSGYINMYAYSFILGITIFLIIIYYNFF
jgi:proton-translocating NADH-quinone oxidoreductase chain L